MMPKHQARTLLQQMLGSKAEFREGQWEAIDLLANQRRRLLVGQRTGWGKSIVSVTQYYSEPGLGYPLPTPQGT